MANTVRIELDKLSVEQLKGLKEQTDLEVNLLQDSLTKIRTASSRLENASAALQDLSLRPQGKTFSSSDFWWKQILVPLTASLYVPGSLDDAEKVLVDVGTGYFIEVTFSVAIVFMHEWHLKIAILSVDPCEEKTMAQGKEYCERKINLLKSNFDELLEVYTKKKTIADQMGTILEAKLRQASPGPSS
ncbi:hypothetical protein PR202_gb08352 [Eleusine coracana subsp. coracana]|uniref:Prefoldin subunit 5 n=1 Tax=Eleusine coracana subsp. coracana TaxID=191504 RepID=A0AAV5EE23_ELECO|nr:hypothetical protein PR202_gb08352 [Eleusine coracana subsp. coracana]